MYKTTKCRRADSLTNKIKSAVMLLMLFVSFGSYAQYCDVTSTSTTYGVGSFITTNGISNISNTTGGGSYSDYTAMSVAQFEGGLDVQFSITPTTGTHGIGLWIDWNNDGDFDDAGEQIYNSGTYVSAANGTITIPEGTPLGDYRIRVVANWLSTTPTPCGNLGNAAYGEAEDYTFSVIEQPDCMPPSGITATPTSLTTVELSWEEGDGIGYDLEWGEAGFDQGDGTLIEDLTNTSTEVTVVTDTEYEFYVRQDCGPDGYSMWVGPYSFETGYCDPVYQYGCSNGAKISNFEITNAILNLANNTGTATCGTNGYNNFTSMSASAPAEFEVSYSVTVGSYSAGVKLWVDWNNNGEFEADELMGQSTSTITSGNSLTGNFIVPAGTPLGDYRMRARVVESTTTFDPCSQQNYGETEDYTFTVIEAPDCMPPTGMSVVEITDSTAEIEWTIPTGQDTWFVYITDFGNPAPDDTTTGYEIATSSPYTIDDLDPSTQYDIYVKSDCGTDGQSFWIGPLSIYTTQIPAQMPFEEDFEGTVEWTLSSGTQTNQWVVGDAVGNDDNSLYISNDQGDTHAYTNTSTTVAHAFRDIQIPTDSESILLSFDWMAQAESCCDYIRVWVVPADFIPTPGTQISVANSGGVQFGGNFNQQNTWTNQFYEIPSTDYAGEIVRLVFEWRNDGSVGTQPPGAIDNVEVSEITCPTPTDLGIDGVTLESADLSWTSDGDLFDIEWGEAGFEPGGSDANLEEGIETNTFTLESLDAETGYEYYVRRDCEADGVSSWAGPFYFFTGYCEATSTYTSDHITAFSTSGAIMNIDNPSGSPGSPNGYANYSTMVVAHYETGEIEFTVTNSISMGINIWVDWNNNLEFEESEKVYASGVTANNFSGSFSVPAGTPLGNYRMRLRGQWGNSNPQPCGNISWGETEDYTLTVIDPPACMPPSQVNIIQVTDDSLELGWTAPAEQDAWQVLVLPAGSPAPDEDTTGWIATTENPFTVEGLDPATEYDAYVRADCSDDGVSLWAGPASATTTQIAADVDFEDDFEGESGWTFTNENQTNQWHIGTATSYEGTSSLYISNDNGASNAYSDTNTITHAIRDLAFPDNTNEAVISFYWKTLGHVNSFGDNYDMMKVWLMPSNYQPIAGTAITADDGGVQIGDEFLEEENWVQFLEVYNLIDFAGNTGRLVFEWRNNTFTNNPPPAAVDNVEVTLVTCSRPIEVTVEKNQVTGNLLATWTPVAGETQWEVIVQAADEPAPNDTATGVIVNEPQYLIEDVLEGEFYKIYVRAICDEDDKSLWTEGVDFSDFNPPACANIDMEFPDLTIDEQGDFIFCAADGQLTLDLVADFDDSMFKSTTSYEVEQIDYAPPFPFLGGIEMPITADDDYTASFELPFSFCFFGNEYSYCRIGDNGVVTFGLPYTTTYGEYCPWTLNGPIPSPTFSIKNAIYGVFQDMLTTNNPGPDSQINYQVLGTYPCRALVVNFNEVPAFGGSCSGEQYRTTTQIVLYEITNIIEIYVANRTACSGWQSGLGVLGIQNEDGTVAYTPPGRNTGAWDAVEEAWRFTPNGETTVDFGWYVNGEFYSDNPVDQIIVTEDTCIEARVSYPGCGGDDLVLSKEYCVKVAPEITLDKPEDIKVCLIDGEYEPIDLTDKIPEAIDTLSQIENFDLADYDISFYLNQSAADAKNNPIPNPESYVPTSLPQTVWVRVEHESTGCYGLTSFDIYQGVGLDLNRPDNVVLCVYFDIIPETDLSRVNEQLLANINDTEGLIVNYYHSQQDAIYGSNPIQNWANFEAPSLSYEIWIKVSGSEEICESITSFMLLEGIGLPEYEHPDFDICTGYVLPMLPDGYFYTTEYLAEGEHIQPGTVIKTPGVHTIYVNIISDEGCITSSSYNVNIIECAVPRGISPNGDGLNDNFDLSDYFLVDLKIFNRDGREVYSHGMGYTNEWEGQSNSGNLLPDGTYYYRIVTPVEELTGWVQLVRETR